LAAMITLLSSDKLKIISHSQLLQLPTSLFLFCSAVNVNRSNMK
jgi:hypothetical protein